MCFIKFPKVLIFKELKITSHFKWSIDWRDSSIRKAPLSAITKERYILTCIFFFKIRATFHICNHNTSTHSIFQSQISAIPFISSHIESQMNSAIQHCYSSFSQPRKSFMEIKIPLIFCLFLWPSKNKVNIESNCHGYTAWNTVGSQYMILCSVYVSFFT